MTTQVEENVVTQKTRELCQSIVEQPEFQSIRQRIDTFMADETSKSQYQSLAEKSEMLEHKQQMGVQMSPEEISDFEKNREALINNPIARDFMDAQQTMREIQESVVKYVSKTFELGRMPEESDFSSGSCGSGCGCH
jgi:cell fate (sporulation/competence/biofilm development) regulator YlbF (YheA/YmcA/DUF963 family)